MTDKKREIDPTKDGVDHINIYSKGSTELGKMLSHFYGSKFTHPYWGPFNCMEGFWYYLKAKHKDRETDALRRLQGNRAKIFGKKLENALLADFEKQIILANYYKINQNPYLKKLFIESTLPFEHYYLHGPGNLCIHLERFDWLVAGFETLRRMFKENIPLEDYDYGASSRVE